MSEAELPKITDVREDDLPKLAKTWGCVDAAIRDSEVVVYMAQVCDDLVVPKALVGETVWRKFYEEDPGLDAVVPHQLVWTLRHVLKELDAKLRAAGGHDAAVAAGKQCVEEASRVQRAERRRALVAPYGSP